MKSPGDPRPPLLTPALAADGVVIEGGRVLLVQRGHPPYVGRWVLPGGFVEVGERTDQAAVREVREETGARTRPRALVGIYSDPSRDPRGHIVSAVYLLERLPGSPREVRGGDDARTARWWSLSSLPPLAFDHRAILRDAVRLFRARSAEARSGRRPRAPGRPRRWGSI